MSWHETSQPCHCGWCPEVFTDAPALPHTPPLACRLEGLADEEEQYKETLLCVNRLWDELNSSIAFLQYRCV